MRQAWQVLALLALASATSPLETMAQSTLEEPLAQERLAASASTMVAVYGTPGGNRENAHLRLRLGLQAGFSAPRYEAVSVYLEPGHQLLFSQWAPRANHYTLLLGAALLSDVCHLPRPRVLLRLGEL